jgi:predicted nucleotide-binding protein
MQKAKTFNETRFPVEVLRELVDEFDNVAASLKITWKPNGLSVDHPDARWSYDDVDEFLADYRVQSGKAILDLRGIGVVLHVQVYARHIYASFDAPTRAAIEKVFSVLEAAAPKYKLPPAEPEAHPELPVVFIGHGRSRAWRDLKDHLQDQHGVQVVAYETGARAGHTIRDILEDLVEASTFALLVLTAEDEQADGALRARQNVIHETGLFQGALGFSRAIMLVEQGVEDFSNVDGIQQIRFAAGNIRETFGDVLATLRREFPR